MSLSKRLPGLFSRLILSTGAWKPSFYLFGANYTLKKLLTRRSRLVYLITVLCTVQRLFVRNAVTWISASTHILVEN